MNTKIQIPLDADTYRKLRHLAKQFHTTPTELVELLLAEGLHIQFFATLSSRDTAVAIQFLQDLALKDVSFEGQRSQKPQHDGEKFGVSEEAATAYSEWGESVCSSPPLPRKKKLFASEKHLQPFPCY